MKLSTKDILLCGLFAALTAVCSQIAIPLPFTPVPINLATLSVFLAGGLLGTKKAVLSQTVYLLLGLIGLPVFAEFSAGPGVLFGATGGYLLGYLFSAAYVGFSFPKFHLLTGKKNYLSAIFHLCIALLFCYLPGTFWFSHLTGNSLSLSLIYCVFPFLPGDALKILLASYLIKRLSKAAYLTKSNKA